MPSVKLIAVTVAYVVLWDALSRWRVRAPERRVQLQLYGFTTLLYILLVLVTGGSTQSAADAAAALPVAQMGHDCIRVFFGFFGSIFLLLGSLELGVGLGFLDPSLPLLSRWWVRMLFEGPVWRMLCVRRPGAPLGPDELEACVRHGIAGIITVMGAIWGIQVAADIVEWGPVDPVAILIALKAINIWLDSRIRTRSAAKEAAPGRVEFPPVGSAYPAQSSRNFRRRTETKPKER